MKCSCQMKGSSSPLSNIIPYIDISAIISIMQKGSIINNSIARVGTLQTLEIMHPIMQMTTPIGILHPTRINALVSFFFIVSIHPH
jgi:hypothetical protein